MRKRLTRRRNLQPNCLGEAPALTALDMQGGNVCSAEIRKMKRASAHDTLDFQCLFERMTLANMIDKWTCYVQQNKETLLLERIKAYFSL